MYRTSFQHSVSIKLAFENIPTINFILIKIAARTIILVILTRRKDLVVSTTFGKSLFAKMVKDSKVARRMRHAINSTRPPLLEQPTNNLHCQPDNAINGNGFSSD